MKTLSIRRNKGWYGRMRALRIFVDETEVAALRAGETASVDVEDHAQFIWAKMDWGHTERLGLSNVSSGGVVTFDAYFTLNLIRSLGADSLPFRVSAS